MSIRRTSCWTASLMPWVAIGVMATGCRRDAVEPSTPDVALPPSADVVAITFTDIGLPTMRASASVVSSVAEFESVRARRTSGASLDLTVPASAPPDPVLPATIQLAPLSATAITHHGSNTLYLDATFKVRNARRDFTAFNTPRRNLTFFAVATAATIGDTPVREILKQDGTPADPALARKILPTSLVNGDAGGRLLAVTPDILEVVTEQDLAAIVSLPPAVTTIFPYGFITRRDGSITTRTLDASPAPDQFDGVVTFAFRIPKQANPDDNPTSFTVMMLALDDSETRVTQSLEEQYPAAALAIANRVLSLGATSVMLLPGGSVPSQVPTRTVCAVRTAGTALSPTEYLVRVATSVVSMAPDPRTLAGSLLPRTTNFKATFNSAVSGANDSTFVVRGSGSGRAFVGQAYAGNGTAVITTPTKTFFANEQIDVTITTALACPTSQTFVYRTKTNAGQGNFFPANTYAAHDSTVAIASGDFNRDGKLDIVAANLSSNDVSVFLGNGDATFRAAQNYGAGQHPIAVAVGDVTGDGILDLVVGNENSRTVSVLSGRGDGTFGPQATFASGTARGVALADIDGNGFLDIVVANAEGTVSILANDGGGSFRPQRILTSATVGRHTSIATADFNRDGLIDLVATDSTSARVSVWLGIGAGFFGVESEFAVGPGPSAVAVADFDGNGIPDIVTANMGTNTISLLLGTGTGSFNAQTTSQVGSRPSGIVAADVDGDGKFDVVTSNLPDREASILIGNGNGTFQGRRTFFIGESPRGIIAGDFASSGIVALAVANGVQRGTISVFAGRPR